MCDAYLVGTLAYLREVKRSPAQSDWDKLLQDLNFDKTDWNFQQNVVTGSRWVDKSKSLAFAVFQFIFSKAALPPKVNDIWDYLSGDQISLSVEFKELNSSGNPVKKNMKTETYSRGDKKSFPMDGRKYFKVISQSVNAKHIEIFDSKSAATEPIKFNIGGEKLQPPKVDPKNKSQDPLGLTIRCILYGGNTEEIKLTLNNWI